MCRYKKIRQNQPHAINHYRFKKNLTRVREIWRPPRKDRSTKKMTSPSSKNSHKHLSKPCDNSFKLDSSSKSKKICNFSASNSINLSRNSESNKARNIYKVAGVIELCSSDENTPDESARKNEPVPSYKKQPKSVSNRLIKPQSHSPSSKVLVDSEKTPQSKVLRNVQHKKFRKKVPKNTQSVDYSSDSDDSPINAKKLIRGKLVRRTVRSVSSDSYASDYDNIDTRKKFGERVLQVNRTLTNVKKTKQPCIQGEVSSTTFPDIHIPTSDQPTTSSFQCHQSSLEVHSSSNLQDFQNGREVGSGVLQILKTPSPDIREKVFMTDPNRPSLSTMTYTDYESLYRDMVRAEQKSIERPCITNFNSNLNYHRELLPYECGPLRFRNFQSTFPLSPRESNIDRETKKLNDCSVVGTETVTKEKANEDSAKSTSLCATSSDQPLFLQKSLLNRSEIDVSAVGRKTSSQKDKFIQTEIEEPLLTPVSLSKPLEAKTVSTVDDENTHPESILPLSNKQTEVVRPSCQLDISKSPNKELKPYLSPICSKEERTQSTSCSLSFEGIKRPTQLNDFEGNNGKAIAPSNEKGTSETLPLENRHITENVEIEACSSTLTNKDISGDDCLHVSANVNTVSPSKCFELSVPLDNNKSLEISCKSPQAAKHDLSVCNERVSNLIETQDQEKPNYLQVKDVTAMQSPVADSEKICIETSPNPTEADISSKNMTGDLTIIDHKQLSSDKGTGQNNSIDIENRMEMLIEEEICNIELDENADSIGAEEENALLCEDENVLKENVNSVESTDTETPIALKEILKDSTKKFDNDVDSTDATDNDKTEAFLRILDECLEEDTLPDDSLSTKQSCNSLQVEKVGETLELSYSSCAMDKVDMLNSCSYQKEHEKCVKAGAFHDLKDKKETFSPKETLSAESEGELKYNNKQQRDTNNIIKDTQTVENKEECCVNIQMPIDDCVMNTSKKEISSMKLSSTVVEPVNIVMESCSESLEIVSAAQGKRSNDGVKFEKICEETNSQTSEEKCPVQQTSKEDSISEDNISRNSVQEVSPAIEVPVAENVAKIDSSSMDKQIVELMDTEANETTTTNSDSSVDYQTVIAPKENDSAYKEQNISSGKEVREDCFGSVCSKNNLLEKGPSINEQLICSKVNVENEEKPEATIDSQIKDSVASTKIDEEGNETCSDEYEQPQTLFEASTEISTKNETSIETKPKDLFSEDKSKGNNKEGFSSVELIPATSTMAVDSTTRSGTEGNNTMNEQSENAFSCHEINENSQKASEVKSDSLSNVDASVIHQTGHIPTTELSLEFNVPETSLNRNETIKINITTETSITDCDSESERQRLEKIDSIPTPVITGKHIEVEEETVAKIAFKDTVEAEVSLKTNDKAKKTKHDEANNKYAEAVQSNVSTEKQTDVFEKTNELPDESISKISLVLDDKCGGSQNASGDEKCIKQTEFDQLATGRIKDKLEDAEMCNHENKAENENDVNLLLEVEKTEIISSEENVNVTVNDCHMLETSYESLVSKEIDKKITVDMRSEKPTDSSDNEVDIIRVPASEKQKDSEGKNNEFSKDIDKEIIGHNRSEKTTHSIDSGVDMTLISSSIKGKNLKDQKNDLDQEKSTYSGDNEIGTSLVTTFKVEEDFEVEKTVGLAEPKACGDSSKIDFEEQTEVQNITVKISVHESDLLQVRRTDSPQITADSEELKDSHNEKSELAQTLETIVQNYDTSEEIMEATTENETSCLNEPAKSVCHKGELEVCDSGDETENCISMPITVGFGSKPTVEKTLSCDESETCKDTGTECQKLLEHSEVEVVNYSVQEDNSEVDRNSTVVEDGTKNSMLHSESVNKSPPHSPLVVKEMENANTPASEEHEKLEDNFPDTKEEEQAEDVGPENQTKTNKTSVDENVETREMAGETDIIKADSTKTIDDIGTKNNDDRTSIKTIEQSADIDSNETQKNARAESLMIKSSETDTEANGEQKLTQQHNQGKQTEILKNSTVDSKPILLQSSTDGITESSDAQTISSLQIRPTVLTTIASCATETEFSNSATDDSNEKLWVDNTKLSFDPKIGNDFSSRCERDYLGKLGKAVRQSGGSMNKALIHDKIVSDVDHPKLCSVEDVIASKSQLIATTAEENSGKVEGIILKPLENQPKDGCSQRNAEFICPSSDVCSNFFLRNKKSVPNEKALIKSPEENYERTPFKLRIKRRLSECANNLENLLNEDKCTPCKSNTDALNCPPSTMPIDARSEHGISPTKSFANEPNKVASEESKTTIPEFDCHRENVISVIPELGGIKTDHSIKHKILSPKVRQSSCSEPPSSDETEVDIEKQQIWMNKLGLRKRPKEKLPLTREEPKEKKEKGRLNKLIISRRETTTPTGIVGTFTSRINAAAENTCDTTKKGETVSLGPSYNLTLLASEAEKLTPIVDAISPTDNDLSKFPRSGLRSSASTQSKKKGKSLRSTRNSCTEVEKEEIELNVRNALQIVQNKPKSALKNPNSKQRKEKRTVTFADTMGIWKQKKLTEFLKLLRSSNGRLKLTSNLKDKLSEVLMILSEYSKKYDINPSELCIKNDEFLVDMSFDDAELYREEFSKKGTKTSKKSVPKKDIEQIIGDLIVKTLQKHKTHKDQLAPPKIDYEQGMKIIQSSAVIEYIEPGTNTMQLDLGDDRDQPLLPNENTQKILDDSAELSLIIKAPSSKRGRKPKINNQKTVTTNEKKGDEIKSKKSVGGSKKQIASMNLSQLLYPASKTTVRSKDQFADITLISDNESSDESLSDYLYKSNQYLNAVLDNKSLDLKNHSLKVSDTTRCAGKYVHPFANVTPLPSSNDFLSVSVDQSSTVKTLDKKKTKKSSKKGKQEVQQHEAAIVNAKHVIPNVQPKANAVVTETKLKAILEPEIIIENAAGSVNLDKREGHNDIPPPSNSTTFEEFVSEVVQDVCRKQSILDGLNHQNINSYDIPQIKNESKKNEVKSTTINAEQKTCVEPIVQNVKTTFSSKSKLHSKVGKSSKTSSSHKNHSTVKVNQIPENKSASPSEKRKISRQINPMPCGMATFEVFKKEGVHFDIEGNMLVHSKVSPPPNSTDYPVSNVVGANNKGNIFWDLDGNILPFNLGLATDNATFPIKEDTKDELISVNTDVSMKLCNKSINDQESTESTESASQNSPVSVIDATASPFERKSEKLVGSKKRKSKRCKQLTSDIIISKNAYNECLEDPSKGAQGILNKKVDQFENTHHWATPPINGLTSIEPTLTRDIPTEAPEIPCTLDRFLNHKKEGKNPSMRKTKKVGLLDMVEMLNNSRKEVIATEKIEAKGDENIFIQTKALDLSAKIKSNNEAPQENAEINEISSDETNLLHDAIMSCKEISTPEANFKVADESKSACSELKAIDEAVEVVSNNVVSLVTKEDVVDVCEKQALITPAKASSLDSASEILSTNTAEANLNKDVIQDVETFLDSAESPADAPCKDDKDIDKTKVVCVDQADQKTSADFVSDEVELDGAEQKLRSEADFTQIADPNSELTDSQSKNVTDTNLNNMESSQQSGSKFFEKTCTIEEGTNKEQSEEIEQVVDAGKNHEVETSEDPTLATVELSIEIPIPVEVRIPPVATKASKKDMTQVLKLMKTMQENEIDQEHEKAKEENKIHKITDHLNLSCETSTALINSEILENSQHVTQELKLKSIKLKISTKKEDRKIQSRESRKQQKKNKKKKVIVADENDHALDVKDVIPADKITDENVQTADAKDVIPADEIADENVQTSDAKDVMPADKLTDENVEEKLVLTQPETPKTESTKDETASCEIIGKQLLEFSGISSNPEEILDSVEMDTNENDNNSATNNTSGLIDTESVIPDSEKIEVSAASLADSLEELHFENRRVEIEIDNTPTENIVEHTDLKDAKNLINPIAESVDENLDIAAEVEIVSGDSNDAEVGKKVEEVHIESTMTKTSVSETTVNENTTPLPLDLPMDKNNEESEILLVPKEVSEVKSASLESNSLRSTETNECSESIVAVTESIEKVETGVKLLEPDDGDSQTKTSQTATCIDEIISCTSVPSKMIDNQGVKIGDVESSALKLADSHAQHINDEVVNIAENTDASNDEPAKDPIENSLPIESSSHFSVHSFIYSDEKMFLDKSPNFESCDLPENLLSAESPSYQKNKVRNSIDKLKTVSKISAIDDDDIDRNLASENLQSTTKNGLLSLESSRSVKCDKGDFTFETTCTKLCYVKLKKLKNVSLSKAESESLVNETKGVENTSKDPEKCEDKVQAKVTVEDDKVANEDINADHLKNSACKLESITGLNIAKKKTRKRPLQTVSDDAEDDEDTQPKVKKQLTKKRIVCDRWENEERLISKYTNLLQLKKMFASRLMQFLCTFERSPTLEVFFTFNKILVTFIYETLSSEDYSTVSCARTYLHLCTKTKQLQSKNIDEVALDEIEQKYTLLKKKRNEFRSLEKIKLLDDFLQQFKLVKKNLFNDTWIRKNYNSIQRHLHMEPIETHFKAETPENVEYVIETSEPEKPVSTNNEPKPETTQISPHQENFAIKKEQHECTYEVPKIDDNNMTANNKESAEAITTVQEKEQVEPRILDTAPITGSNVELNKPSEQVTDQDKEYLDCVDVSRQISTLETVECDNNVGAEEIIATEKDIDEKSPARVDCDADIGSPSMLQNSEGDITSTINNTMMKLIQIGNLETISSEMDPFSMTNSFSVTGDMNSSFKTTDAIGFDENLDNGQNHGSEDWPDLLLESIMEDLNAQKDYSGKKKEDCMISGRYDVRNYFPEASLGAAGVLSPLIENNMTELVSLENENMENASVRASTDQSVNMNDILKESLLLRGNNLSKCEGNSNGNFVLNAVSPFDILVPLEPGDDIPSQPSDHISSGPAVVNFDLNSSADNNLNALDFVDYVPEVVDTILTSLTLNTEISKSNTIQSEIPPTPMVSHTSISQVPATITCATSAIASSKETLQSLPNNETKAFEIPNTEPVTSLATTICTQKASSVNSKLVDTCSTMSKLKQFYIPEKDLREASTSKMNSNQDIKLSNEDTVDVTKRKSPGYTKPKPPVPKPQVPHITSKLKSHPFPSWKTVSPVKRDVQNNVPISKSETSNSSKNISLSFSNSNDGENTTGRSNVQSKQVTPSTLLHMPDLETPQNTTLLVSKRPEPHPTALHVKKDIIVASQKLPSPFPTIDDTQYICSSFGYSSEVEVETSSPGPVAKKRPRGNSSLDASQMSKKPKVDENKTMDPFDKLKSEPVNVPLPNNAKYRKTYSKPAVVNTHVQVKPSAPVVSVVSAVSAVGSVLSSKVSPVRETNYTESIKNSSTNKVKIHVTDCEIIAPPTSVNKPTQSSTFITSTQAPVVKLQTTNVHNSNIRRPQDSQTIATHSTKKRVEATATITSQTKVVHVPPSTVSYKVFTYNPPTSKSAVAQNASNRIKFLGKDDESKNIYKRTASFSNDSATVTPKFKVEESKTKKVFSQPAVVPNKPYTHTSQLRNINGSDTTTPSLRYNDHKRTFTGAADKKRRHSVNESQRSQEPLAKSHSRHGNIQQNEILDSAGATEDPKVTPLTVRTAWDYKPISTDEILEHLAKQKKLKSN